GSNPAPAIEKGPGNRGLSLFVGGGEGRQRSSIGLAVLGSGRTPARGGRSRRPGGSQLGGGGGGRRAGPMKAKTWSVPGRSSRPSPTDGVAKWFATSPKGIETTSWPLAGLR